MATCWQILGVEENCDSDNIRKAYLSLLPQFHPENDPDGFKRLRNAYEAALLLSQKQGADTTDKDFLNRDMWRKLSRCSTRCCIHHNTVINQRPSSSLLRNLINIPLM